MPNISPWSKNIYLLFDFDIFLNSIFSGNFREAQLSSRAAKLFMSWLPKHLFIFVTLPSKNPLLQKNSSLYGQKHQAMAKTIKSNKKYVLECNFQSNYSKKEQIPPKVRRHSCVTWQNCYILFLGIPQIVSNINACQVIGEAIKTTLGPRGLDKMIIDQREKVCLFVWQVSYYNPSVTFQTMVQLFSSSSTLSIQQLKPLLILQSLKMPKSVTVPHLSHYSHVNSWP